MLPENFNKIATLFSQSGGQSGAFIFGTSDNKLILKTITKDEKHRFLIEILDSYVNRISHDPESKLVRILGLFKIHPSGNYILIMESIIADREVSMIFDLKGSEYNRYIDTDSDPKNPPYGVVLKDVNFNKMGFKFDLGEEQRQKIIQTIRNDVEILQSLKIIDYSLLIAIYSSENHNRYSVKIDGGRAICFGIIDFFKFYTIRKASEKTFKSMFSNAEVSSANSETYANRFLAYIEKIFI